MMNQEISANNSGPEKNHQVSRRDFLKLMNRALLGLGVAVVTPPLRRYEKLMNGLLSSTDLESGNASETAAEAFLLITETYGLEIYNGENKITNILSLGNVSGEELSREELEGALQLVAQEILKYPPNFFKKNNVNSVRFMNNITYFSDRAAGLTLSFGDFSMEYDDLNKEYRRATFHHEIFHCLTLRLKSIGNFFAYKKNYIDGANANINRHDGALEDIAELAEQIMLADGHAKFIDRINYEPYQKLKKALQVKYSLIKQIYFDLSDGAMDEEYWRNLIRNKIDRDYFN
ncbi:MAG: hypothetical protein COZ34_03605 [Candidatus Pacebacteria bacterium CG_4_10_14_3_um_filter_34_15]|nr:hypothetical protein [Candidatus Pacearchaeota archaeon]NCQ65412.1 hypothetical protein [Candidatus Paceibacterota bacterium]OIO44209.1 MAG: hypothetical protein AUJ41_03430 [Candidatus Pacebacteria bacterium CG1_02_43_31]PIX81406.1 MAG: hypothetical protein COZ34_03605 [Candidatus Pacebacteria bacterium CG_4_10_14_3_um_filter_34_15]PJC43865.1 MAG: hypothetical protein CO039_01590 [Candidatus Pacebacteria bacterium CG_4_9_14_0_2_um_filter_34_50]